MCICGHTDRGKSEKEEVEEKKEGGGEVACKFSYLIVRCSWKWKQIICDGGGGIIYTKLSEMLDTFTRYLAVMEGPSMNWANILNVITFLGEVAYFSDRGGTMILFRMRNIGVKQGVCKTRQCKGQQKTDEPAVIWCKLQSHTHGSFENEIWALTDLSHLQ